MISLCSEEKKGTVFVLRTRCAQESSPPSPPQAPQVALGLVSGFGTCGWHESNPDRPIRGCLGMTCLVMMVFIFTDPNFNEDTCFKETSTSPKRRFQLGSLRFEPWVAVFGHQICRPHHLPHGRHRRRPPRPPKQGEYVQSGALEEGWSPNQSKGDKRS